MLDLLVLDIIEDPLIYRGPITFREFLNPHKIIQIIIKVMLLVLMIAKILSRPLEFLLLYDMGKINKFNLTREKKKKKKKEYYFNNLSMVHRRFNYLFS